MNCPVCNCEYNKYFRSFHCESFDDSLLYKDIYIVECNRCGHIFNELEAGEISNLKKYYKKEHIRPETSVYLKTLNLGTNDVYSIPFSDNSLHQVILNQVLEHSTNLKLTMSEVRRVLDKGGLCYINIPDVERYNDNYFYLMREHVQHFSLVGLKLLAQSNGFELINYERNEVSMIGTVMLPNLLVTLKLTGQIYCWGIGREFMYLYPNTRLKYLDLILVDDTPEKQKQTFKGMKIHSSDILKDAAKESFLIITAGVHKDKLIKKAKEIGFKGEIIDV